MRRVAWTPSQRGIRRSIWTTSGASSATRRTATSPSAAEPTTSIPGNSPSSITILSRTSVWSSATKTRVTVRSVMRAHATSLRKPLDRSRIPAFRWGVPRAPASRAERTRSRSWRVHQACHGHRSRAPRAPHRPSRTPAARSPSLPECAWARSSAPLGRPGGREARFGRHGAEDLARHMPLSASAAARRRGKPSTGHLPAQRRKRLTGTFQPFTGHPPARCHPPQELVAVSLKVDYCAGSAVAPPPGASVGR
ncbi:hypothetical protein YWIDRAFT_05550 [Streptomyces sp. SceaMP-e96]|nr:hypothetical protein YWIDRAFT_05550 [Streptomyces sp. SceaMP-e96]